MKSSGKHERTWPYTSCAVLMAVAGAAVLYFAGLNAWTVLVSVVLLGCPVAAGLALLEKRRAQRHLDAATDELGRSARSKASER